MCFLDFPCRRLLASIQDILKNQDVSVSINTLKVHFMLSPSIIYYLIRASEKKRLIQAPSFGQLWDKMKCNEEDGVEVDNTLRELGCVSRAYNEYRLCGKTRQDAK